MNLQMLVGLADIFSSSELGSKSCHIPRNLSLTTVCLRIEYYDELSKVEASEGEEAKEPLLQTEFAIKVLQLSELSLELGTSILPQATPSTHGKGDGVPCLGVSFYQSYRIT